MNLRAPTALAVAVAVVGGGATAALAATAESIRAEATNSKADRRLTVVADVAECDLSGGYACYTATFSVHTAGGRRIVRRPLVFDENGEASTRYRWTCRHAGLLRWRIRVSDGESSARRQARFRVVRCS